jgi:hypothetical protein
MVMLEKNGNSVRTRAHLRLSKMVERARDKRQAICSPCLTLPHPALPGREGRVLRQHGLGEGESEVGAEIKDHEISRGSQYNAFSLRNCFYLSCSPTQMRKMMLEAW